MTLYGLLHWVILVLVGLGSLMIVGGFIRTSYANDGRAKVLASFVDREWAKLTHRSVVVHAEALSAALTVTISGTAEVSTGPLDPSLTDAQKIDRLWVALQTMETNQKRINRDNFEQQSKDRIEYKAAHAELAAQVKAVRSELVTGLRESALSGLWLAAWGAFLVACGSIVSGSLFLFGLS